MSHIDNRPEKTKYDIKEAFWKLFEEAPVSEITVTEIARVSGYSRYTFYKYFRDVYDVLEQIEEDILRETDKAYMSVFESFRSGQKYPTVDDIVKASLKVAELQKKVLPVLFGKNGDPLFHDKMRSHYSSYLRAYFPGLLDDDSMETRIMVEFYTGGIISALSFLGRHVNELAWEEVLEVIYRKFGLECR